MRKILIYGGSSAIAVAYAKEALSRGDQLCLVGRSVESLNQTAQDLRVRFDLEEEQVGVVEADFQDNRALEKSWALALKKLDSVDQVLIAHGSLAEQEALEGDLAEVQFHHQVNYLSAVTICETAAKYFLFEKVQNAQISVISSVAGDRGRKSNYFYGASKGALSLYLQGLRARLNSAGVSVLTVKPGFVDTPMTAHLPKGALWAKPDQIAKGIMKAENRGRNVVYLPFFWIGIMTVIKLIPEAIFKKLSI